MQASASAAATGSSGPRRRPPAPARHLGPEPPDRVEALDGREDDERRAAGEEGARELEGARRSRCPREELRVLEEQDGAQALVELLEEAEVDLDPRVDEGLEPGADLAEPRARAAARGERLREALEALLRVRVAQDRGDLDARLARALRHLGELDRALLLAAALAGEGEPREGARAERRVVERERESLEGEEVLVRPGQGLRGPGLRDAEDAEAAEVLLDLGPVSRRLAHSRHTRSVATRSRIRLSSSPFQRLSAAAKALSPRTTSVATRSASSTAN
jgi:hypothetical protein